MTEDFLVKNIGNGITIKHDRLTVLHNFLNENLGLFFFFLTDLIYVFSDDDTGN